MSPFTCPSHRAAEHGCVGKRRAAWRITTSVELASRRRITCATEYEEFMAESVSEADEVEAAVASDVKALAAIEGRSSDLIVNIDALSEVIAPMEKDEAGGRVLQGGLGANPRREVMNMEASDSNRPGILSFLPGGTSDGGRYGPESAEIIGTFQQLMDEMSVGLQTVEKEE